MFNCLKNIRLLLYVNSVTLPFTFFSILAIFSFEYKGIDESNSYLFSMFISIMFVYVFFLQIILKRNKFLKSELFFYILPILILLNGLIAILFFNIPCDKTLYQFIIFVIPAILFGVELGRNGNMFNTLPFFLFVAVINTLGFISVIPKMLTTSTNELITFYGGGHYQAFSYSISFAYLTFFVYFLFYEKNRKVGKSIVYIFIFLIDIIGIVLSGGRGGFVVIFFGTLFALFVRFPVWKGITFVFFFFLFMFVFGLIGFSYLTFYQDRILDSFGRLFSYLSTSGIAMDQTSNRDLLYDNALKWILQKPIFGFGIFRYLNSTTGFYPHNFFLEVLLQGGIFYLIIWLLILGYFFISLKRLFNSSNKHFLIIATFVYSFTQLLFSGTYLLEPFFWFSLAYVFTSSSRVWVNFQATTI